MRVFIQGACVWSAIMVPAHAADAPPALSFVVVGTGQSKCYDNATEIACPRPGQSFYGQDAQQSGIASSYRFGASGVLVIDTNTGLMWQRGPDTDGDGLVTSRDKLSYADARKLPNKLNAARFGGYSDWRLPSIKELYSLILFSGVDASGPNVADTSRLTPFIDTRFFKFAYGDINAGERTIDSQWATSTSYVADPRLVFGVNFADGRIKGYGTSMPGRPDKTFYVLCVRGNPDYGKNVFRDNGNGTISDRATNLMWSKADSGNGMNWQSALAWVQARNAEKHLGYNDWRLPNAKELQTIVDYARSPETSRSAAIDPAFNVTIITNEIGQADYPYYWTATTHAGGMHGGEAAVYVAFGRAPGWLPGRRGQVGQGNNGGAGRGGPPPGGAGFGGPPPGAREYGGPGGNVPPPGEPWGQGPRRMPPPGGAKGPDAGPMHPLSQSQFIDVHGAGAQRSDPKTGDPSAFPHGRGPQGDVIRIYNFVRLVRTIK